MPGVPAPIGIDRCGREVLEFLPGEVPNDPMPPRAWDDEALVAAATWLCRFHDATTDFDTCSPGSRVWDLAYLTALTTSASGPARQRRRP